MICVLFLHLKSLKSENLPPHFTNEKSPGTIRLGDIPKVLQLASAKAGSSVTVLALHLLHFPHMA